MKKNKYINIYNKYNNQLLEKNVEQVFKNRHFITIKSKYNKTFDLKEVKVKKVKYEKRQSKC
ncbi:MULTISPECIES: hypothetical protein [Helcococcus]|uniref:Uncharacterized protein n=1 Tax=Helcococcus bovis TaxID=3153252 RepID=A0ABW9F650_9FIRM